MIDTYSIRPMAVGDLAIILVWRNDPVVRTFMLTQHEITPHEHRNWFLRLKRDKTRQQLIVMDGLEPIGFVQFNSVCRGGISEWGFYVRPGAPKGTGRKLGQTALGYAFDTLNLHKVCGQALEYNKASIGFHQNLGFKEEGRMPDQKRIGEQYHTLLCFGLLAKDWREKQQSQDTSDVEN